MQTTHKLNRNLGSLTITHPFHPLFGKSYTILEVKEIYGSRRYSLLTDSGVLSVPESWTDRYSKPIFSKDSYSFSLDACFLHDLVQLLKSIDDFSRLPHERIEKHK